MRGRSALVALTAATIGTMSACGIGESGETTGGGERALVTYSREGGIRFQSSRVTISAKGEATVRSEGCAVRFRPQGASLKELHQALERIDFSALAGDHPAPRGAADVIAETIIVGAEVVRIGDFNSLPPSDQRELMPLVAALGEILEEGKRRSQAAC